LVTVEINLAHTNAYVDEMVIVPEDSIQPAWREFVDVGKLAGEAAVAVSIAATCQQMSSPSLTGK
jgi:threonine dehydratase